MRDFNDKGSRARRSDDRFRRRDDNRGGSFNRSGSGSLQMYPATCDECGKSCEVPFRPTGDRPVYCSDCFERIGGGDRRDRRDDFRDNRRDNYRDNRSLSFGRKKMFSAICDKCGKECEVPFRPTGDRPVYCSDCFEKSESGRGDFSNAVGGCCCSDLKSLLVEINAKLDKIMKDLGTTKFVRVPKNGAKEESNEKSRNEQKSGNVDDNGVEGKISDGKEKKSMKNKDSGEKKGDIHKQEVEKGIKKNNKANKKKKAVKK